MRPDCRDNPLWLSVANGANRRLTRRDGSFRECPANREPSAGMAFDFVGAVPHRARPTVREPPAPPSEPSAFFNKRRGTHVCVPYGRRRRYSVVGGAYMRPACGIGDDAARCGSSIMRTGAPPFRNGRFPAIFGKVKRGLTRAGRFARKTGSFERISKGRLPNRGAFPKK